MIEAFEGVAPRVDPSAFVHPRATVIGDVEIGAESSVWPGAVIRGDLAPIRIGARTSIQDNAVIHVNHRGGTSIGDDCVVGHLAFAEEALVEDACMIAVGAVLHGATMRTESVAAANAVLVGGIEVPTGHRAQGVPARIVAAPAAREEILRGAAHYVEMARRHRDSAG